MGTCGVVMGRVCVAGRRKKAKKRGTCDATGLTAGWLMSTNSILRAWGRACERPWLWALAGKWPADWVGPPAKELQRGRCSSSPDWAASI